MRLSALALATASLALFTHTPTVHAAGRLWAAGQNTWGQLGKGDFVDSAVPVPVATDVAAVSAGEGYSLYVTSSGDLYGMGFNRYGQLGTNDNTHRNTPVLVATGVSDVAAGSWHTLILKNDNTVWVAGYNNSGQRGDGTLNNSYSFTQVNLARPVQAIAVGAWHSLALTDNGELWGWGNSTWGQLGLGNATDQLTPQLIATDVKDIAAGAWHTLFIKNDGTLMACGYNLDGELGDGSQLIRGSPVQIDTNVASVAAGNYHSLYAKANGALYVTGRGNVGQLGDGTGVTRLVPFELQPAGGTRVFAGGEVSTFIDDSDSVPLLRGTGHNSFGQIGDGTKSNFFVPTILVADGEAWDTGQLHSLMIVPDVPFGIALQPTVPSVVLSGSRVEMEVAPAGVPVGAATYQWFKDGVAITGATFSYLVIQSVQGQDRGSFTVRVSYGGTDVMSDPAVISVDTPPATGSRLVNLSTRGPVITDNRVLIASFVLTGTGNKRLLLRAAGPALVPLGLSSSDVVSDPQIVVSKNVSGSSTVVGSNNNWGTGPNSVASEITAAATAVGAFAFATGSTDSALLLDLDPGTYSVITSGVGGVTGVGLAELYDMTDAANTARLVNISTRGFVNTGNNVLIPGFVISNEGAMTVLIRGVGPTLTSLGLSATEVLADPALRIYNQSGAQILQNDDWSTGGDAARVASISATVGAFPLPNGSKDAAVVITLSPGIYTAQVLSVDSLQSGIGLVEVYFVP